MGVSGSGEDSLNMAKIKSWTVSDDLWSKVEPLISAPAGRGQELPAARWPRSQKRLSSNPRCPRSLAFADRGKHAPNLSTNNYSLLPTPHADSPTASACIASSCFTFSSAPSVSGVTALWCT